MIAPISITIYIIFVIPCLPRVLVMFSEFPWQQLHPDWRVVQRMFRHYRHTTVDAVVENKQVNRHCHRLVDPRHSICEHKSWTATRHWSHGPVHFTDNTTRHTYLHSDRSVGHRSGDYLVRTKRADARDILAAARTRSDHRLLATAHRQADVAGSRDGVVRVELN